VAYPRLAPSRVEVIHETQRTRVIRLFLRDGSTVIRKEILGSDRRSRLRHEIEVLQRLSGVKGVVQLAASQTYAGSIILDDVHGAPLANISMPVSDQELVNLALELARVVAELHRRGVVHRDINPAKILMSHGPRTPCLVDFGLATTFAELRPEFTRHSEIVGALSYLAPEQTGRTGRPVDWRADLYALGATLYELATGSPPFATGASR
jgi:serine/threonine protein kinase